MFACLLVVLIGIELFFMGCLSTQRNSFPTLSYYDVMYMVLDHDVHFVESDSYCSLYISSPMLWSQHMGSYRSHMTLLKLTVHG